ncbi:MAG: rod shape-determining protein MreD [Anaerolineae bacterium]|nr:rod shape-determining protein MreD [Anaerolineae bacterium]
MTRYIGIPVLMIAALLNATVMTEIRIGGGAPDLVFLLVVSWAMLSDLRDALTWSVVGGLFQDWLSVAPLGTSALGLVIVAFVADSVFGRVHHHNILIPPLVAAAGTVVYHLSIIFVLRLTGTAVPLGLGLFYVTISTVIYNTIMIVPVFRVVGAVYRTFQPRRTGLE